MHYRIEDIQELTGTQAQIAIPGALLTGVGFDSRRISRPGELLFFALDGKTRSGSDFVKDAYDKGVRNFAVKEGFNTSDFSHCNFIFCSDVLQTLSGLAAKHRSKFTGPVIGITGSNGKTIVKEWLNSLLHGDFVISRSPRSYNSTLGAAISLLGIEQWHNMAIIEAGISKSGDMEELESMIHPVMGIFTHLGTAHDENFSSKAEKAAEKMKLFAGCDVLVYPADVVEIKAEVSTLKKANPLLKTFSWGYSEGAGFRITKIQKSGNGTEISFVNRATTNRLWIPFTDMAGIENAMTCLCALAALERWDPEHIEQFKTLAPLENRLVFSEGKNGNYLVNDSYSNDTDSLEVALDFLLRQQPGMPHTVILSDLQQADPDKDRLYRKVAEMLAEKKTGRLIGVGAEVFAHQSVFSLPSADFFPNVEALLESGELEKISAQAVLIKGARSFRMERVYELLRKQVHKTVLEIDLTALRNNFSFFRHKTGPGVKIMAMVKAFGYGSGSFEASRTLQFAGADYLAVAYADEGVDLRKAGIHLPVMVMNTSAADIAVLSEYKLEPVVFSADNLKEYIAQNVPLKIHVEIDTGMHRLGFDPDNCGKAFESIPDHIKIASVFSHLAASESPEHDDFTRLQLSRFNQACDEISKHAGSGFIRHIANTGGILRFPQSHLDMVRLGIGLYGVEPSGVPGRELETVLTLKTTISQVKEIPAGDSVGYGRRGVAGKARRIAVLPLGYADGLWRLMGNGRGHAIIHGKPAPYIGSICMDMAMVDVTDISCSEGDEAEIFGRSLRVETLAGWCETIPYEILTSVSERVRREYSGEN